VSFNVTFTSALIPAILLRGVMQAFGESELAKANRHTSTVVSD